MNIEDYQIISTYDASTTAERVKKYLREGWILYGDLVVTFEPRMPGSPIQQVLYTQVLIFESRER